MSLVESQHNHEKEHETYWLGLGHGDRHGSLFFLPCPISGSLYPTLPLVSYQPNGISPRTVANFQITQRANAQGIYGATWGYAGQAGRTKFSTMFPDRCTQQEVLNSILYAAAHRQSCPGSAPDWAWCGRSAPAAAAQGYCNGDDNNVFTIAGASLRNGNINTAFPLR